MKRIILIYIFSAIAIHSFAQVPDSGLVAEYTFTNGSLNDGIGTNNASSYGNVTNVLDRFGNADYAKDLDGAIATYLSLGNSATLKPSKGTISIWVDMEAISGSGNGFMYNPIFFSKNTNAPGSYMEACAIMVRMSNSTMLGLTTEPPTNEKYFFTTQTIPAGGGNWTHLVLTYDDTNLKGYIDNVLVYTKAKNFVSNDFHPTKDVLIGNSVNGANSRAFNGRVDDIRIYNRALDATEVGLLFNEANPYTPPVVYAELGQKLDGGYFKLKDGVLDLPIKFTQEYAVDAGGEVINFGVYDWERNVLNSSPTSPINFSASYGINWENIDLSGMGLISHSYYTLEFKANKGETYILRFKTGQL